MKLDQPKSGKGSVDYCDEDCNPRLNLDGKCNGSCFQICPLVCKYLCVDGNPFPSPPVSKQAPPPRPRPPKPRPEPLPLEPPLVLPNPLYEAGSAAQKHVLTTGMIIMGGFIGAAILVCILATILRARNRISTRSRSLPPIIFATQEDFLDEDQGPQLDHPIWYINTVGLQQSVIDSIAVFKYKKDEGLIEGTECSVCLNEFQEDESLRLLPKCSHAFHIPCIDTWLRSHKNCPLCRAPVISDNFDVQVELPESTSSDLSSTGGSQTENSTNNSGLITISNSVGEDGTDEVRDGDDTNCALPIEDETIGGNSKTGLNFAVLGNHSRVQSDLVDTRLTIKAEMQPVRRSASLDSSSAMAIYSSVGKVIPGKHGENLDIQMVRLKHSKSKNVLKRGSNGNISFRKLMKSSSISHALQKAPIAMKRSFSSSGKSSSSSSRLSRSQDSILPF